MIYKYQEVIFTPKAAKTGGYTVKPHNIRCDIVMKKGDEVFIKLHKNKWLPAQIIRVMGYEVKEAVNKVKRGSHV